MLVKMVVRYAFSYFFNYDCRVVFKHRIMSNLNLNPPESFLTILGRDLVDNGFHIYTGFGAGVGNYILAGVLQSKKNRQNGEVINDPLH